MEDYGLNFENSSAERFTGFSLDCRSMEQTLAC
jgi:hypothetical protein